MRTVDTDHQNFWDGLAVVLLVDPREVEPCNPFRSEEVKFRTHHSGPAHLNMPMVCAVESSQVLAKIAIKTENVRERLEYA